MKTCFPERKLMKQFGNPPFLSEPPPFQLTPLIPEQFFHDCPLCPNFKKRPPPNFRGEETMLPHKAFLF